MKKFLIILLLITIFIPFVINAAWWNPLSWNIFSDLFLYKGHTFQTTTTTENKGQEKISASVENPVQPKTDTVETTKESAPTVKLMVLLNSTKTPMSVQADPPSLKSCSPSSMCYKLGTKVTLRPVGGSESYSWTGCDKTGNDEKGNYCVVNITSTDDYIVNVGLSSEASALPPAISRSSTNIAVQLSPNSPALKIYKEAISSPLRNVILGVYSFNPQKNTATLKSLNLQINNYKNAKEAKAIGNVRLSDGAIVYPATSITSTGLATFSNLKITLAPNRWKDLSFKVDILSNGIDGQSLSSNLRLETIKAFDTNNNQAHVQGYMDGAAVPSYVEGPAYLSSHGISFDSKYYHWEEEAQKSLPPPPTDIPVVISPNGGETIDLNKPWTATVIPPKDSNYNIISVTLEEFNNYNNGKDQLSGAASAVRNIKRSDESKQVITIPPIDSPFILPSTKCKINICYGEASGINPARCGISTDFFSVTK